MMFLEHNDKCQSWDKIYTHGFESGGVGFGAGNKKYVYYASLSKHSSIFIADLHEILAAPKLIICLKSSLLFIQICSMY